MKFWNRHNNDIIRIFFLIRLLKWKTCSWRQTIVVSLLDEIRLLHRIFTIIRQFQEAGRLHVFLEVCMYVCTDKFCGTRAKLLQKCHSYFPNCVESSIMQKLYGTVFTNVKNVKRSDNQSQFVIEQLFYFYDYCIQHTHFSEWCVCKMDRV